MSLLTYNGVTLPYAYATDFRQEAVYEESGTDRIYTRFDITVQSIVHTAYLNQLAPDLFAQFADPNASNAAEVMTVIRQRLLQQRKALSYTFNGVELIPLAQTGNKGTVDARNGPQPQYCNCTLLTNETFLVVYRLVAHYWENIDIDVDEDPITTNLKGCNILTNRWSETVDINYANFTIRTREGKFIIRSDNESGFIADQLRMQMAILGVDTGFLRLSSSYTVDPSGLAIAYRIIDQEQFKMPPSPAFRAEGDYSETATTGGAQRMARCRVRLEGDRTTSQAQLVTTALTLIATKLALRGRALGVAPGFLIPQEAVVRHDLYHNVVEASCVAMIAQDSNKAKGGTTRKIGLFAGFKNYDTITPLSDNTVYQPPYLDFGSAGLLVKAAAYFDPSVRATFVDPQTRQLFPGAEVGTLGKNEN